jgi:signal transduction histidine kinase
MKFLLLPILSSVLVGFQPVEGTAVLPPSLHAFSLTQLEQRRDEIDQELSTLAHPTLRSGVGNLGWRSRSHDTPNEREQVEIQFKQETLFDEIVFVPLLWRDDYTGLQGDAFPNAFQIFAGRSGDTNGTVIATRGPEDCMTPRIAPLVIPVEPTTASWIRIEITELSPRVCDERYAAQLSEIMIFNQQENVALRQSVKISSVTRTKIRAMPHHAALVDGFTPFVMNSAQGDHSRAYVGYYYYKGQEDPHCTFTVDLGESYPLNGIDLHAAGLIEAVPQLEPSDFAQPWFISIEGANQPDFKNGTQLVNFKRRNIYETGPILFINFPETDCRYLRIRSRIPYKAPVTHRDDVCCFGYAEIEIYSRGINVARGKEFKILGNIEYQDGNLENLSDGRNSYGNILPQREWVEQLARRHELEVARPVIEAEMNRRYEKQKVNLRRLGWLVAVLAAGTLVSILIERIIHLHQIALLQERFAADLHDELGADLHTIGLLSDLAADAGNDPKELSHLLKEIRTTTEDTGEAVRFVARTNTRIPYLNLVEMMKQIAERVMVHLVHEFTIEGSQHLNRLKARTRSDLFLFYKEALVNICRHAEATHLKTHLKATANEIRLTIADDGQGLPDITSHTVPKSLHRRAHLMGAKVEVAPAETGGTSVTLILKTRNKKLPFWRKP